MKHFKRILVAVCLATVCLTAATAKQQAEKIDLTEIGVDSVTLSRLSDSTVVRLTLLAIQHKESVLKEEMRHEEQLRMMKLQNESCMDDAAGILFVVGIFSAIPVICLLIYNIITIRSRRHREEANNAMLLNLVSNGQTLTPELVEAITHDKEQVKKAGELTMHTSLHKLFLGIGLIVFAIVCLCMINGAEPFSPLVALIGIFYAAQGLAGYLTLTQAARCSGGSDITEPSENE